MQVFVTGMGWTTPLGTSLDQVWNRLLNGESGFRPIASSTALRSKLAAMVMDVPMELEPAERQLLLTAKTLTAAFAHAGLSPSDPSASIVMGTSYGSHLDTPATESLFRWADLVAQRIGHPRAPAVVTTACSAASDSILVGAELVRSGFSKICVCGGADIVTLGKRLGHSVLGTMSDGSLQAYDERHAGMLLGEGAGFLVLESEDSAMVRRARVHAVLRGAGSANDATGLTAPDPTGKSIVLAIRRCLAGSGLAEADVAILSGHATGTPTNDRVEATSLREVFGGRTPGPVVFASKGALGHSLGACGAIEAITVIQALATGTVPPIVGLETPLAEFPLRLPVGRSLEFTGTVGMSLTLGFGGFNTCLMFSKAAGPRGASA